MMKKDLNQNKIIFYIIPFFILILIQTCLNSTKAQTLISKKSINSDSIELNLYYFGELIIELYKDVDSLYIEKYYYKDSLVAVRPFVYEKGKKQSHGNVIIWDKNGRINYSSHYKIGKLDGVSIIYMGKNTPIDITNYKNGLLDGISMYYYNNNNIVDSGLWRQGYKIGEWKYYYENGNLQAIGNYSGNAVLDSTVFMFFNDSCKSQNFTYIHSLEFFIPPKAENKDYGEKTGIWKFYNCDGTLIRRINFSREKNRNRVYE